MSQQLLASLPVNSSLTLPSSNVPSYSSLSEGQNNALFYTMLLNDIKKPTYNVRLKVTISGQGINLRTKESYQPRPIYLAYNVPLTLTGADLAEYFHPDNLEFSGISKQAYLINGQLPEGVYSVCIEAYDYQPFQEQAVSNNACAIGLVQEQDPPVILSPIGGLTAISPQHYNITWQSRHISTFPVEYELSIYEYITGFTPDQILKLTPPVFRTTTMATSYLYGPADPLLREGKNYIILVQARNINRASNVFKNNGFSEFEVFSVLSCIPNDHCNDGDPCTSPDIYDDVCNCIGTPLPDSDGDGICDIQDDTPNCAVGFPCDDNDECTINDVYFVNSSGVCDCAGTASGDSDGDGICDAVDDTPNCAVGLPCDDSDGCTLGDLYVLNSEGVCDCIGVPSGDVDADGVCDYYDICPNGDDNLDFDNDCIPDACDECVEGAMCDDQNDCTINDTYTILADGSCSCEGEITNDSDNDGLCDAIDDNPNCAEGISCDDGNECTIGDVYMINSEGECECLGILTGDSDGDGICDALDDTPYCPVGKPCDDGNPCTENDIFYLIDGVCICQGTIVPVPTVTVSIQSVDPYPFNVAESGEVARFKASIAPEGGGAYPAVTSYNWGLSSNTSTPTITPVGAVAGDGLTQQEIEVAWVNTTDYPAVETVNLDIHFVGGCQLAATAHNIVVKKEVCQVGEACDDGLPCTFNDTYQLDENGNCICSGTDSGDADMDGICDSDDECPYGDDNIDFDNDNLADACDDCVEGAPCDDNDPTTINDVYVLKVGIPNPPPAWADDPCECIGTPVPCTGDADLDGVCDEDDLCPGSNDLIDSDGDGIPDGCDECEGSIDAIDVDVDGIPDGCDDQMDCEDRAVTLMYTEVEIPQQKCVYCTNIRPVSMGADYHFFLEEVNVTLPDGTEIALSSYPDYFDFPYGSISVICSTYGISCMNDFVSSLESWLSDNGYAGTGYASYNEAAGYCQSSNRTLYIVYSDITFSSIRIKGEQTNTIYEQDFVESNCIDNGSVLVETLTAGLQQPCTNATYEWNTGATTPSIEISQDIEDYSVTVTCADDSMTCVYSSDYHNHCIGGFPCDDLDDCTINDTMNEFCDCVGEYSGDSDGDGVCDTEDLCPDENDYIDLNDDGIPDCMDCIPGSICDDGNPCTFPDVYDVNCNCFGKYQDEDGDGVCDEEDQCPGFPDYIDVDQDGVPDGCDEFDCLDGSELYPSCELVKNYCACSGAELIDLRAVSAVYAELFAGIIQLDGSDSDVIISGDETLDEEILYNDEVFQNPYTDAEIAQIIPLGTTSLTDNNNDGIYDQLVDSDGDGVCNLFDICPGNPDFEDIDSDGDGEPDGFRIANDNDGNCLPDNCNDCHPYNNPSLVPDFAMIVMHMFNLECNSNDDCSDGTGVLNCDCECETLIIDSDGDGICDEDDDCPGGDNNLDDDNDGIPNGCDPTPCGENISCVDGDSCTIGDVWMLNENGICECTGTTVPDADGDGTCDLFDLCEGEDDSMDDDEDGVPNGCDLCDNDEYGGNLGDPCDDGDECTILDQLRILTDTEGNEYCDCAGIWIDSDNDSVCDANDACEGWDDLDDYDLDGEPDGCDPPYYEIGCPKDAYIVHENFPGLIMIFDINDVTEDQLPNPIGIDILVTAGSSQDAIMSYNQVAISSFQTVDNQIHVFYGIENLDSEIMQNATNYVTTISYSDHQTCVYDLFKGFLEDLNPNGLGNEMTFECPNEFYTHPENNVFAFNVPFNDQVNISNLPSQIHINCVFSDGSSVNETYDITSVEVQTINTGKVFVLSTSFTPPVNDLSGISGTISFSNGLDCSYSTGNIVVNPGGCYTGQPCDDGDPITHSDTYDVNCNCVGILGHDLDGDGEHDSVDGCPEGSDEDLDGNGVPDLCECPAPVIISTEVVTGNDIKITLEENGEHASYIVVFQGEEDAEPTTLNGPGGTVSTQPITIPNVATNTNYQITISAICYTGYESASASTQINVPVSEIDFDCGEESDINSTNTTPLDNLLTGDIVIAGDFSVNISNITNTCGPGEFTGTGYMEVPYFNSAQVNVTFTCAQIGIADDGSYYLIGGSMVVTGAGIEVISEEVADLLGNIVNTLEDIDDVLGQVEEALEQLELVAGAINDLGDYFANGHDALEDILSIANQLPYLPESATTTLQNALDCFESMEDNSNIDNCVTLYQTGIQELQDAIDELYNADYQVIFKENDEQAYGFDGKDPDISAHINNYNLLTINEEEYYVAWKSVKTGQNDKVDATLKDESALPNTLTFEDQNQQPIPTTIEGNKASLTVHSTLLHEDVHEIFAVDKDGDEVHLAGKLNIVSYDEKALNVVIVPVNNTAYPTTDLAAALNDIYSPAVVHATVNTLPNFSIPGFSNAMPNVPSGWLSAYTDDMNTVINAFKNDPSAATIEENTYYLFVVNAAADNDVIGYMPYNKQFGFIYANNLENDAALFSKAVAHELGHGAFLLRHTFTDYPALTSGSTSNLMDYSRGTILRHYQWKSIHNPQAAIFNNGDDEDGQYTTINVMNQLREADFDNDNGTFTFVTPAGTPITLPENTTEIALYTGDALNPVYSSCDIDKYVIPAFGSLKYFVQDGKTFFASYNCDVTKFTRYKTSDGEIYYDNYTKDLNLTSLNAVVGFPCVSDSRIIFQLGKIDVSSGLGISAGVIPNQSNSYTGEGNRKQFHYLVEKNITAELEVFSEPHPAYSDEAKQFLDIASNLANCGSSTAMYIFAHAHQITKYPGFISIKDCLNQTDENLSKTISDIKDALEYQYQSALLSPSGVEYPNTISIGELFLKPEIDTWEQNKGSIYEHFSETKANEWNDNFFNGLTEDEEGANILINKIKKWKNSGCVFAELTPNQRKKALRVLSKGTLQGQSIFNAYKGYEENIFNFILGTTPENQYPSILNAFKENNYALFFEVAQKMDAGFDPYIGHLTMMLLTTDFKSGNCSIGTDGKLYCDINDQGSNLQEGHFLTQNYLPFFPEHCYNSYYIYDANNNIPGEINLESIHVIDATSTCSSVIGVTGANTTGAPFDYVGIYFAEEASFNTPDTLITINAGDILILPYCFVDLIFNKFNANETNFKVRTFFDIVAIATVGFTGTASMGIKFLSYADAAYGTVDLFIMAPDAYDAGLGGETALAQDIHDLWNAAGIVLAAANATGLIEVTSQFVKKFNFDKVKQTYLNLQSQGVNAAEDFKFLLKNTYNKLKNIPNGVNPNEWGRMLNNLKAQIAGIEANKAFVPAPGFNSNISVHITNNHWSTIVIDNVIYAIGSGEFVDDVYHLKPIVWIDDLTDYEPIGTFQNYKYIDQQNEPNFGNLEVYRNINDPSDIQIRNIPLNVNTWDLPEFVSLFNSKGWDWSNFTQNFADIFVKTLSKTQQDELITIMSQWDEGTDGLNTFITFRNDVLNKFQFREHLKAFPKNTKAWKSLNDLLPQVHIVQRTNIDLLKLFGHEGVTNIVDNLNDALKGQFFDNLLINHPNKLVTANAEIVHAASKEQYLHYLLNLGTDLEAYYSPFKLYGYKSNNRSWSWYLNNLNTKDFLKVGLEGYEGMKYEDVIDIVLNSGQYSGMSKSDAYMAFSYTTNYFYGTVNDWIRLNQNAPLRTIIVNAAVESLSKLPKFSSNTVFYRGIKIENGEDLQAFLNRYAQGNDVTEDFFQSVATNVEDSFIGRPGYNIEFTIYGKVNTNSECRNIHDFAMGKYWNQPNNRTLSEGVFLPGTTLKVVNAFPAENGIYRFILAEQ
ncbi:MAG: hypothetical protein MI974_26140 [Chitinophagales bacterium]|nr:hypothetical protein [Chitinophagales bacterium]